MLNAYRHHLQAAGLSAGTISQRLGHIYNLNARLPHLPAATTADLEQHLAALRERGLAAETRKSVRASYRSFYRWAHEADLIPTNPAAKLRPIRIPVTVPRLAPDDDLRQALTAASMSERAMIMLARFGCLRLTELSSLHTKQREGDRLRVTGKGDKQRIVYLNADLAHALNVLERLQGDGYYFPGRFGGHMHPQAVNKIMTRRTGWNPHALRHAGATAAYRATKDLRAVQLMLGHASMATTQRYLHPDDDALRAVANATGFQSPPSKMSATTLAA